MIVHQVKHVPCKVVLDESEDSDSNSDDTDNTVTEKADNSNADTVKAAKDKEEIAARKLVWVDKECEVLKVTLHTGEEYAIDLAGAQYGFYEEPVIDWGECVLPSSPFLIRSHAHYANIP